MKLKYDDPLSSFAFNFNLRRYHLDSMLRELHSSADMFDGAAAYTCFPVGTDG